MTAIASPDISTSSHHVTLTDKNGIVVGLILVDGQGFASPTSFARNPVETSSLKTSSGNQGYGDLQPPYAPIAQDDWSGGRGNKDFEKATSKFADSYRLRTTRANKVFLGPQEQYSKGNRSQNYAVPGNVTWVSGTYGVKFTATAYTAKTIWLLMRPVLSNGEVVSSYPTVNICSDNAGSPGTVLDTGTFPSYAGLDFTSEWVSFSISEALSASTVYWIVFNGTVDWEIGVSNAGGSNTKRYVVDAWVGTSVELYFRVQDAEANNTCIFFEYKKMLYKIESHSAGAPHLYRFGYRGVCDSNAGHLDYLLDAAAGWTADALIGRIVRIIAGPGASEAQPWRTITDNDDTKAYVDTNWITTHTANTEYVIYGVDTWNEITGHGMTHPVTDVFVCKPTAEEEYVIFCVGNDNAGRGFRAWNNTGTFTNSFDVSGKAKHALYAPSQMKVYRSYVDFDNLGRSTPGDPSTTVGQNVGSLTPPAFGVSFTGADDDAIGNAYESINGLELYQDDDGNEAIWVFKPDGVWIIAFKQPNITDPNPAAKADPYQLSIANQLISVRSDYNGTVTCRENEYIWWNLLQGLQRYYQGHLDDMGPNQEEGLPTNRRGVCSFMISYPGRMFAGFDAGSTGYSSVLEHDNGGWHERYRAPYGQRIRAGFIQVVPGNLTRFWIQQGNDSIWLPLPQDGLDEITQTGYLFTHEGSLELSWMHSGMMDIEKFVRSIKIMSSNLSATCTLELDYKIDEDTTWTCFEETINTSPWQRFDLDLAGMLQGKRIKIRVRFRTTDATYTPVLEALVVNLVSRMDQKNLFSLPVRVADNDKDLNGQPDNYVTADSKLAQLDAWASGETGTMLLMNSTEKMYDNRLIFLPAVPARVLVPEPEGGDKRNNKVYICSLVGQDA